MDSSSRVAEVVRRHEGSSPKSLDLDENFKPLPYPPIEEELGDL